MARSLTKERKDPQLHRNMKGQVGNGGGPEADTSRSGADSCFVPVVLVFLTLGVYVRTVYPSVPGGDSGEIICESYLLGLPHPPGYPTMAMLGHLFTYLPIGDIAWRINFLSCVCNTVATVLVYFAIHRLCDRDAAASFVGGGMYAFSPLIWTYAVQAEVFALNNLCTAAVLLVTVHYFTADNVQRRIRLARWGALLLGLGLTNQHTLVLFGVPIVAFILVDGYRALLNPVEFSKLAGLGLVGLLPYAYLFIRGRDPPALSWGSTSTLQGFWTHVTRSEYGSFQLYSGVDGSNNFILHTQRYLVTLNGEMLFVGVAVCVFGMYWLIFKSQSRLRVGGWCLLCACCFYLGVFHYLANLPLDSKLHQGVHMRFWMQPNLVCFIFLGVGCHALFRFVTGSPNARLVVAFSIVALQIAANFDTQDMSSMHHVRDFGANVLNSVPKSSNENGTLLLVQGDLYHNSIRYNQVALGLRPDVVMVSPELMSRDWHSPVYGNKYNKTVFPGWTYHPHKEHLGAYSMKTFLDVNFKTYKRIFLARRWKENDFSHEGHYTTQPIGLVLEILPVGKEQKPKELAKIANNRMPQYSSIPDPESFRDDAWEREVVGAYVQSTEQFVDRLATLGMQPDSDKSVPTAALNLYERYLERFPDTLNFLRNRAVLLNYVLDRELVERDEANEVKLYRGIVAYLLNLETSEYKERERSIGWFQQVAASLGRKYGKKEHLAVSP